MRTCIVYFDETGDDGLSLESSDHFVLTSVYMPTESWQNNYNLMKIFRKNMKDKYGFHVSQEMHTKYFLTDKNPYRAYNWSPEIKREILIDFTKCISSMNLRIINVIIDKTKIKNQEYNILETALTYSIQRIENDSKREIDNEWNYLIITDEGRLAPMRHTARAIRAFNPVQSKYSCEYVNEPIKHMVEDIMEKKSSESYFIQVCDFVSYFAHLYFDSRMKSKELPKRVSNIINVEFVGSVLETLRVHDRLNLKANDKHQYGFVIYPK